MQIPTNAMGIMFVTINKGESARDNMGDWLVQQRIAQSISIVTEVVHKYGGIVGKTLDNAVLSTFPKADKASKAACEIQYALFADSSESTVTQAPMEIRICLNHGKMMVAAGNVAGPEIDIVVQLCNSADADQILVTEKFFNALGADEKKKARCLGKLKPEGLQTELTLHELIWTDTEITESKPAPKKAAEPAPKAKPESIPDTAEESSLDETAAIAMPASEPAPAEPPATTPQEPKAAKAKRKKNLEVTYKTQQFTLNAENPSISIGRKIENDIVIDQAYVSRKHAVLECREDGFFLQNLGANGTRVFIGQGNLGERCREEMQLNVSGKFTLGPPLDEAVDEIIYYKLT